NTRGVLMDPIGWLFSRFFLFSSRRRHTRLVSDWSSDVCSSDLDQHDLAAALVVDLGLAVHLGHEGTGGIEREQIAPLRLGGNRRSEERRVGKEGRVRRGREP